MVWLRRIRGAIGKVVPLIICQSITITHNGIINIPDTKEFQIKDRLQYSRSQQIAGHHLGPLSKHITDHIV